MDRRLTAVLSTVAIVAVMGLPGCSNDDGNAAQQSSAPTATTVPSGATAAPPGAPLPAPDALAGVLYRLADASVPGSQKLNLVEGATPENAGAIDQFANALINGGYAPVKFDLRDIRWSDRDPADAVANVDVSTTDAKGPHFGFPMEFKPAQGNWQLAARTADVLLAFGSGAVEPPPPPPPPPGH